MDLDCLTQITGRINELKEELARELGKRDAEIFRLARARTPRRKIADITGLAEISIYKIIVARR